MSKDKVTEALLEALKQTLTEGGELRLFKSGKLDGLFASRSGVNGEAAARALRDHLLEVIRTETRGKTTIEWVRLTPQGVNFLHEQESPRQALEDLHAILQANRDGVPVWLRDMQQELQTLGRRLAEEAKRWTTRLEALSTRVEEALRRVEEADTPPADALSAVPWAAEALTYLDRRQKGGAPGTCPLPELFAAVRETHADLSMIAFHDGLRRLQDRRTVRLLPFEGPPSDLAEPEYALLDGADVLYYVAR